MVRAKLGRTVKIQSAMEYLMTYGWAILIIAVVLGSLFQLGVFNSSSFAPRAPPGACQVFRPGGPGTTTNINLMGVCTGQLPQYVANFNGQNGNVVAPSLSISPRITLASWVYYPTSALNHNQYPIAKGCRNDWWFYIYNWPPYRFYWEGGGSVFVDAATYANAWHFFAGTSDGSQWLLYVDGKQAASGAASALPNNNYLTNIGGCGTTFFAGSLANVQIYNTSLSANEIQALYLEGMGGAPLVLQNLVGWWPLNGNSNDYSGNNNNGVPTAVTFTSQYGR